MTNIPMTRPSEMIAEHHLCQGHSTTWVQLDSGRILMAAAGKFRCSDDGGVTWGESYTGQAEGESGNITLLSMVKLDAGVIGATLARNMGAPTNRYDRRICFCQSTDEGRTWSKPMLINPCVSSFMLQDTLLRTGNGRLICPAYTSLGQGMFHQEGTPFVGGYINGNFVSTDAHFYDPHFAAANIFYSDDEGQTWQRNHDGELFVVLDDVDSFQGAAEPCVCEAMEGKLLMLLRTRLGRFYQAWSEDNGETWTRPKPTQLASTQAPAQVHAIKSTGHLLCVFTQQSEQEIRHGFIRTRLSSAVSRNNGGLWEHFQNVESIHEETHVEPGPIKVVRPEGRYPMTPTDDACECNPEDVIPLPVGYGRWSYPSVLVLQDRVLISYTYSRYDKSGQLVKDGVNSKMKVLPIEWFYGGQDPHAQNMTLKKLTDAAQP